MFFVDASCHDEMGSMYKITDFLAERLVREFGDEVLTEACIIKNDPHRDSPIIFNVKPSVICLAVDGVKYWSQVIFQLSHEMCHFAMRLQKKKRYFTLLWYEELVCSAYSLYSLTNSGLHWQDCALSQMWPTFGVKNLQYVQREIGHFSGNEFRDVDSVTALEKYERERIPVTNRDGYNYERTLLFKEMRYHSADIRELCKYQNYLMPDKLRIDFEKWISETGNKLVEFISTLIHF